MPVAVELGYPGIERVSELERPRACRRPRNRSYGGVRISYTGNSKRPIACATANPDHHGALRRSRAGELGLAGAPTRSSNRADGIRLRDSKRNLRGADG